MINRFVETKEVSFNQFGRLKWVLPSAIVQMPLLSEGGPLLKVNLLSFIKIFKDEEECECFGQY